MANLSLSSKQQRKIEALVRGWSTKLTWDLLIKAIKNDFDIKISRQSLHTYRGIKNEYDTAKARLRGASPELVHKITQSDIQMTERVKRLEAEKAVMQNHIDQQLALIERMIANANDLPNIDVHDLVKPRD
jgi:hypothetical protein